MNNHRRKILQASMSNADKLEILNAHNRLRSQTVLH